jgi:hypothetical protein
MELIFTLSASSNMDKSENASIESAVFQLKPTICPKRLTYLLTYSLTYLLTHSMLQEMI